MRKFHFIWEFLEGNRKRMAAMIIWYACRVSESVFTTVVQLYDRQRHPCPAGQQPGSGVAVGSFGRGSVFAAEFVDRRRGRF